MTEEAKLLEESKVTEAILDSVAEITEGNIESMGHILKAALLQFMVITRQEEISEGKEGLLSKSSVTLKDKENNQDVAKITLEITLETNEEQSPILKVIH